MQHLLDLLLASLAVDGHPQQGGLQAQKGVWSGVKKKPQARRPPSLPMQKEARVGWLTVYCSGSASPDAMASLEASFSGPRGS